MTVPRGDSEARPTGNPWWGRLIVALAFDAAVVGLAYHRLGQSPEQSVQPGGEVVLVVGVVLAVVLVLNGPGRWPLGLHGAVLLLSGLVFWFAPAGLVAVYRWTATEPTPAAVLSSGSGYLQVRLDDGRTVRVARTGDGLERIARDGSTRIEVWTDPLGLASPSSTATPYADAPLLTALAGAVPFLLVQVEVVGVVGRRRGDSVLARYGGGDASPSVPVEPA